MDNFAKKCEIARNEVLGRYVNAAVDIKAGETVLLESPVLIIPCSGEKRCANCLNLAENFCSNCKVFPLCENCAQHNEIDCKSIKDMTELQIAPLQSHNDIHGLVKCLLLKENAETKKYFDALMQSEAHLEQRRTTEIWQEHKEKRIAPILKSGLTQYLKNEPAVDEQLLQHICAIVDVNCFEMRAPDAGAMRGIYPTGALFSHNCVANLVIAIDELYQMKIYANRDVPKGEMLTVSYTNALWGTDERRQALKLGKYFDCTCERCMDPTELGSHMSSLICAPCASNEREGFIVKKQNKWQCLNCAHTLRLEQVEKIIERVKEEIFHAKDDIYRYEMLLAKLSRILHRNHFLMIDLKQNIAAILRSIINNLGQRPGRKVYERKVRLCQEILMVLQFVQPGISRLKAIALYELCNASAELGRLLFSEKTLNKAELKKLLEKSEAMLRESLRMLLYEPVESPEGKLAKNMLKELKDLQNDMKLLEENTDADEV